MAMGSAYQSGRIPASQSAIPHARHTMKAHHHHHHHHHLHRASQAARSSTSPTPAQSSTTIDAFEDDLDPTLDISA